MIEMVLMCLKEINCPDELQTLLVKFFGPAFKIIIPKLRESINEENGSLRPTKRQKTHH